MADSLISTKSVIGLCVPATGKLGLSKKSKSVGDKLVVILGLPFRLCEVTKSPIGLVPIAKRRSVVAIASGLLSIPIHLRSKLEATAKVVPEPEKQSSTKSPGFDDAPMILANKSGFYSVG